MSHSNDGTGPDNAGHPGGAHHGITGSIDGDMQPCGLCGRLVGPRALFCHGCGGVLPPRPLDPFARLGVEARFDLDLAVLERQLAGFTRVLNPERFASRGRLQQANARAQAEALAEAHAVLRDPVRRAHALLRRVGDAPSVPATPDPDTAALSAALASADDAAAVDHVAAEAARLIEESIRALAGAFRRGMSGDAAVILARLEAAEAVAQAARTRRADF